MPGSFVQFPFTPGEAGAAELVQFNSFQTHKLFLLPGIAGDFWRRHLANLNCRLEAPLANRAGQNHRSRKCNCASRS